MEYKVSKEVAEEEFSRFAQAARLDLEKPRDESERTDVFTSRDLFIYHVMLGDIVVDEGGWATVKTQCDELPEVRFTKRPKVSALRVMDKHRASDGNARLLSMIGETIGIAPARLNALDYADFEIVSLVFNMFLV
jgi:hypothetical protein